MPQGRPQTIPNDGLTTRARRNAPVLAVHTGAGKGKSTAAFGMALRAWNSGFNIAVFQLVKSAKWKVGEEAAFRELVSRYVDLVYSAAIRLVNGDAHLAEDVTQTVFADLARMARSLSRGVMLGGWLHRHTCFVAGKTMRSERRRLARERQ